MMKVKIALLMILLAAMFATLPVQAETSLEPLLPFGARVSAIAGPPPSGPPPWEMDVYGFGVANHMGNVTVYQHHTVAPTADPNVLVFYDGTYLWTAANGDQLSGTYSGQLVFNPLAMAFEIHGYFIITDGTGRFQCATGGGPASGFQYMDGTALLILDGTIRYFKNG